MGGRTVSQELDIQVAGLMDWEPGIIATDFTSVPFPGASDPPRFSESLDACAEFERAMTDKVDRVRYMEELGMIINRDHDGEPRFIGATPYHFATATPEQRCRAFVKMKGGEG